MTSSRDEGGGRGVVEGGGGSWGRGSTQPPKRPGEISGTAHEKDGRVTGGTRAGVIILMKTGIKEIRYESTAITWIMPEMDL